ncbi:MAG: inositol monophosphatase family protein [Bacteroidales bacterium]|jgi:myo-inositol-1(or 4)-monophosphatase|nr:inositol monophosphatase family protein [Bacteroidales bacterium]
MNNYQSLAFEVIELSKKIGQFLLVEIKTLKQSDVEEKGLNNLVTHVDKSAEKQIVNALSILIPESGFIAEEGTSNKVGKEFNWIVDPLDGTTNFIHGVPLYSVSIALRKKDELVLGVIYEPNLDECFYTWKGAPSYLNGNKINVSSISKVASSLFATGFPYHDYSKLDNYLQFFAYLMRNSRGVRRLGSAAVDLAYVACGRYDGFYEYGLSPWDVAAGILIVQNAGGFVYDFSGEQNYLFGKEIITMNQFISNEFLCIFKKIFLAEQSALDLNNIK